MGSSVNKVVEILNSINPQTSLGSSSSSRIVQSRSIFDYIENFQWNSSKYRLDKPISQLVKMISPAITLDNDVRTSYQLYQLAKSNF